MKVIVFILRSAFALFFLAYGINFFYHINFLPPINISGHAANDFMTTISKTHYLLEAVYGIEIACGFFLLINRFTPLFLIILLPITINIFLFNYFYDEDNLIFAGSVLFYHFLLMIIYRRAYRFLFLSKARFMKFKMFVNFKD
ncbi:MAG: DoxX family membrane protein [Mucilaginibacter sp.]